MKSMSRAIIVFYYLRILKKYIDKGTCGNSFRKLESLLIKSPNFNSKETKIRLYGESLHLHLYKKIENRNLVAKLTLIKRVLETRGRLRWLCHHLLPKVFGDAYALNRIHLLIQIIKNWQSFQSSILSRLELSYRKTSNISRIDPYEYTHPDTRRVLDSQLYVLENEFNQRLLFRKEAKTTKNENEKLSLLFSLIQRNSQLVKTYLQMNPHLLVLSNINNTIDFFPQLRSQLDNERQLEVVLHDSSSLNFDQRLAFRGDYPDSAINVEIWHQRFIVQENRWIVIDSTSSPYQDFVAGHWQFLDQIRKGNKSVILRSPSNPNSLRLDKAIYLIGRCDENWFHLLMDTLPRYLFMNKLNVDVPVLIRSDLPNTSMNFLSRVITNPLILVDVDVKVEIKTLYFLASRSTTYDTNPRQRVPQVDFSPRTISLTRNLVLHSMTDSLPDEFPEKAFLPRESKYRNLINSSKILEKLEFAGFQKVEVNQDFFRFQHVFFNSTHVIAAPGGAILANMIFMNADSRLIVFRSYRDLRQSLWKKLSEASNVKMTQVFGVPTYFGRNKLRRQHSDFYCSTLWIGLVIKQISN